jgi:glycosyltransferase involved in cell wall biosynthesis
MKKILLFISSEPGDGGSFQYDLCILDAVRALPGESYRVVVFYTDRVWESHLEGMEKVEVSLGRWSKRLFQLLLVAGFPLRWLHAILPHLHPLARELVAQRASLYLFPSQETSWSYLLDLPALAVIHDLMHRYERRFPEVSSFGRFAHRERHFSSICRLSRGVLVDSEFGKAQVQESYATPGHKIFPLPFIPPHYLRDAGPAPGFSDRYPLPAKFIFYPAQFWQHKNHARLIRAIHAVRAELPDIQLILVGSKKNGYQQALRLVGELGLEDAVHFLGYVPNADLPELYRRARALVMPTFFGPTNIPPLEAFALGCPVAVSNIYGIPEQVGDAALLFDPESVPEIAAALRRLWTDDSLCAELIRNGKVRDATWGQQDFTRRFLEIVNQVA